MTARLKRRLIDPMIIPVGVAIVVGAIIITIGEFLIAFHRPELGRESFERIELWFGLFFAIVVILGGGYLSRRPPGSLGILERNVVIGKGEFFAPEPEPIDEAVRNGPPGTIDDIAEGYILYARSGALARVIGMIPGSDEYGRRFRGYIYAQGLHGASDELWIPVEAVMVVYPQTRSAFLAIKGDETEHYGWNRPPASMRRAAPRNAPPTLH